MFENVTYQRDMLSYAFRYAIAAQDNNTPQIVAAIMGSWEFLRRFDQEQFRKEIREAEYQFSRDELYFTPIERPFNINDWQPILYAKVNLSDDNPNVQQVVLPQYQEMVLYLAFEYSLNRSTHAVDTVQQALNRCWPKLTDELKLKFKERYKLFLRNGIATGSRAELVWESILDGAGIPKYEIRKPTVSYDLF